MNLRVNDEKITLNVFQEVYHTVEEKSCMRVEEEDLQWKEKPNEAPISSPVRQEMDNEAEKEGKEHVKAKKRRQEEIEDLIIGKEVPDIKPAAKKEEPLKKGKKSKRKIPKGWRNKKIPTEGFSKGNKVRLIYQS